MMKFCRNILNNHDGQCQRAMQSLQPNKDDLANVDATFVFNQVNLSYTDYSYSSKIFERLKSELL